MGLKNVYSVEEIIVAPKEVIEIESSSIKDIEQESSNYENDSQVDQGEEVGKSQIQKLKNMLKQMVRTKAISWTKKRMMN